MKNQQQLALCSNIDGGLWKLEVLTYGPVRMDGEINSQQVCDVLGANTQHFKHSINVKN